MSYSFSIAAASRAEAKQKIASEFDAIVKSQPVHAVDRDAAQAAAEAFVEVLSEPDDGQEIRASVSGYVSWRGEIDRDFQGANLSISATVATKDA